MIDLSNNNDAVNFRTIAAHRQYRVYLKLTEGTHFRDATFDARYREARNAGLIVGCYHFARPSENTPREEAEFFLRNAPQLHTRVNMRHCLDLEDPNKKPGPFLAAWAQTWLEYVRKEINWHAILYGNPSYLGACDFRTAPAWLWLASYGRDDGREYPYTVPRPWNRRQVIAHQYASTARVPGVGGECDISHVFYPNLIDVRRLRFRGRAR